MGAICGATGAPNDQVLEAMLGLLRHRGRAAQVSSSPRGPQLGVRANAEAQASLPAAASEDGRVRCVIDGRLFASDDLRDQLTGRGVGLSAQGLAQDAELVANLFMLDGVVAFEQLDGAFALALATPDRLLLVRDALGEKPLYYAPSLDGAVVFASEIKALFAHPAFVVEPNVDALHRLLVFSFIPGPQTMFRGVCELQPGHWVQIDLSAPEREPVQRPHWHLTEQVGDQPASHWVEQVAEAARLAVAKRVPAEGKTIAFLSGGIDSSAVVALLAERGLQPICYSVGFGKGLLNELAYARMVTEHLEVEQRVLTVTPSLFIDLLPTIIWSLDDPLCDCITVPNFLLAKEAAREAPLVFNGEGGDPLFGGPKNKFMILGEWYRFLGDYDRAQAYLASYHKFYDLLGQLYTDDFATRTGGSEPLEAIVRPYLEDESMGSFLNRLMHMNVKLKGGQNILVKVDKMLGAHGVEAASPLFDRHLAELSFAVPPQFKRRGDVEKYVFKQAVEPLLPRPVVYRKKAGMGVPLSHWFKKTELRDYAHDLLLAPRALARGYFRPEFVKVLLSGVRIPRSLGADRSGELLWMLLAVELWHRVFAEGERPSVAADSGASEGIE